MQTSDEKGVRDLTPDELAAVSGGDKAREAAALDAYRTIARMDKELNEPDPAPPHVSMRL